MARTEPLTNLSDLPEWVLDMYIDGEAPPQVAAALDKNGALKAQGQKQRQFDARLLTTLYRFDCPTPDRLRAYYWKELPPAQQQRLEGHVAQCPLCAAELASLQRFMQETSPEIHTKAAFSTSASGAGAANSLPQRMLGQAQALVNQMRIVVAQLVAPAVPELAPVAFRGEAPTVQLFETPDITISLLVQREPDATFTLAGQILTIAPMLGESCKLISANVEEVLRQMPIDSNGNFVGKQLLAGAYQLIIMGSEQAVIIPNLVIS